MSDHGIATGSLVRVALDSGRTTHSSRVGTVEFIGDTHARVRFDSDDEFTYWFRRKDLVPAHSDREGGEQ